MVVDEVSTNQQTHLGFIKAGHPKSGLSVGWEMGKVSDQRTSTKKGLVLLDHWKSLENIYDIYMTNMA